MWRSSLKQKGMLVLFRMTSGEVSVIFPKINNNKPPPLFLGKIMETK
jgi:hypothetical protein